MSWGSLSVGELEMREVRAVRKGGLLACFSLAMLG